MTPRVAVVTINWNGIADTISCIQSLLSCTYDQLSVFVIDNHSDNNEAEKLRITFADDERVTVIPHNHNAGFTGGNNLGITRAIDEGYPYILLINNDALVPSTFLTSLVEVCENDKTVGAAAPEIRNESGHMDVVATVGGRYNLWTGIFSNKLTLHRNDHLNILPGACLLLRTIALKKTGGFDNRFFLYWEEADLCFRLLASGFRLTHVRSSHIYHLVAQSTKYLSPTYVYYMVRNHLLFQSLHGRWYHWISFLPIFFARTLAGYTFLSLINGYWSTIPSIGEGLLDFLLKRFGKR